jgi:CHAT domain-containing protein
LASDSIGDGVEDYDAIALEVRSTRRQYLSVARLPCATVVIASVIAAWAALILTNRPVVAAQTAAIEAQSPIPGFAESLTTISDLLDRGRGIEAENVARALLARVERARGTDALEVAEVLDLLWRAVRRSSSIGNAEKLAIAERAVAIKERTLAPDHPELATSLIDLGVQRALSGDPVSAEPLLERALAIREAAFGPDHASVAAALQSLGGLRITLHDDEAAKVLLERAQRIREAKYGVHHPDTIRTLVNLAILYQDTGDFGEARRRYERALLLAHDIAGPASLSTLNILTGAAVVLGELGGDFAGSAALNRQLLSVMEQAIGSEDPRLTVPLENLAIDLRELGDYRAAKGFAERSLAIAERAFGANHPEVAGSAHTLATIVAGLGDYAEALRLFERATRINEEALKPSNPDLSRASWIIPGLLPLSGYAPDDALLFEAAVATREKQVGRVDAGTSDSLTNLAALLSTPEDFTRARPLFEHALTSQEKALPPDHPAVAAAAMNLAYVLSQSDAGASRALYERAVSIWEKSLGADHPKVATALVGLARLYIRNANDREAAPLLARALAIQEKALGPEHPDLVATLTLRAETAARAGDSSEAFAAAVRAEGIRRDHLRLTVRTVPERQALAYAASLPSALDVMVRLALAPSADDRIAATAWDAIIRARGLVLDEMAARNQTVSSHDDPEILAASRAFAASRQQLAAIVLRGIRNDPVEQYRRRLDEARREKDRAERDLAQKSARFRSDLSRSRVGLAELSSGLPERSALVAFVACRGQDLEPSYLAFVLRAGDPTPAVVPLGSAARVEKLVADWRRQLDEEGMAGPRAGARTETAYRRAAEALRLQVWDPVAAHLSNAAMVFVVPDGVLHLVSFASLPVAASEYLVETGPVVHYLSTERDLVARSTDPPSGRGLLAMGAPAFDDVTKGSAGLGTSFRGAPSECTDFASMRFDPLPAASKEVDDVVTLWSRTQSEATPDTVRLTGAAATEAAFKAVAGHHRILHLATHGFFLGDRCTSTRAVKENPLLLAGLAFAGANRRDRAAPGEEDGIVTAEEVAALDLSDVEWAVLSGCDTGVGHIEAGEGVFGLRRAFEIAGARTVIMSLWAVEDRATREWMSALYRQRFERGLSTASAVRGAEVEVLRRRRAAHQSTHPFYWAGFVAAGGWR